MYVAIDGSTLSMLFYSQMNNGGSQQSGFLLGQKVEDVKDRISDSQIHTADVTAYTYVSSFIPWPNHKCIHSRSGHVSKEIIDHLTEDTEQTIVGWYNFRPKTSLRPSLKEMSIHKNLTASLGHENHPWDFLFFLCTSSMSANLSTHSSDHCFWIAVNERFAGVPLTVMNLGDTSRKEYQKHSMVALSHSDLLQNTLHQHRKHFVDSTGEMDQVSKVRNLAVTMNKGLKSMEKKVLDSEAALGVLEVDVKKLREEVFFMEQKEMQTVFQKAQEEKIQLEKEALEQDNIEDEEEREQLFKLMSELGIAPEQMVAKEESQMQRCGSLLSEDEPMWLEITADNKASPVLPDTNSSAAPNVDVIGGNTKEDAIHQENKSQLLKPLAPKVDSDMDSDVEVIENTQSPNTSQNQSDDPFAFVIQEVKSAQGNKLVPSRQTRSHASKTKETTMQPQQRQDGPFSADGSSKEGKKMTTVYVTNVPNDSHMNGRVEGFESSGYKRSLDSQNTYSDSDTDARSSVVAKTYVSSSPVF